MEDKKLELNMENENLEQVKKLINEIADSYGLPTEEQVKEMRELTDIDWDAEDLQMVCCEYWSHNSLEETAYLMFHDEYPRVCKTELVFWKYKSGAALDDKAVYEKYRFGKGTIKALEVLPLEEILGKIKEIFPEFKQNTEAGTEGSSYRFECLEQPEYWSDTHFWIFEYGRDTENEREHQILRFSCHNMNEKQVNMIIKCMEKFQCALHIRE